jgi:hypothetical protein
MKEILRYTDRASKEALSYFLLNGWVKSLTADEEGGISLPVPSIGKENLNRLIELYARDPAFFVERR